MSKAAVYISDPVGLERHFCELLKKLMPCNATLVFRHQREQGTFTAANYYNPVQDIQESITIAGDETFITDILVRQKSVTRLNPQRPILPGMRSELFVPLLSAQELLGCLYLSRLNPNSFQTQDIQFIEYAAAHLAFALERLHNQQHLRRVEQSAVHWRGKYVAFLQAVPLPAAVVDRRLDQFDEVNDAALDLFGSNESFIDQPFSSVCTLTPSRQSGQFKATVVRASDGVRVECSVEETRFKEGEEKSLLLFSPESTSPPLKLQSEFDHLQRRYGLLSRLITRGISAQSPKEALQTLVEELLQDFHFDHISLSLIEGGASSARSMAMCTESVQPFLEAGQEWSRVADTQMGWITQPIHVKPKRGQTHRLPFSMPAHFSSLLMHDRTFIGNLALGRLTADFDEGERQLIKDAAALIALAGRHHVSSSGQLEQLAAGFAHELKTPIQNLRSFLQLLADDYGADLPQEPQTFLLRAFANIDNMEKSVMELIHFCRVGMETEFTSVDVAEIVSTACFNQSFLMERHGVRLLQPKTWPVIHANAASLAQIFNNLLTNAMNAAVKNRQPVVQIGFEEREEDYEFFVRDNGPGIPPALHAKIFEMFFKATEGDKGTGLGLPIVKRAVHLHNGQIRVESAEGEGATFRFTIPKTILHKV